MTLEQFLLQLALGIFLLGPSYLFGWTIRTIWDWAWASRADIGRGFVSMIEGLAQLLQPGIVEHPHDAVRKAAGTVMREHIERTRLDVQLHMQQQMQIQMRDSIEQIRRYQADLEKHRNDLATYTHIAGLIEVEKERMKLSWQ